MSITGDRRARDEGGRRITARQARQGGRGSRIMWLLIVSLALIVLVFAGLWTVQLGPHARHVGRTTAADVRQFQQAPTPAKEAAPNPQ